MQMGANGSSSTTFAVLSSKTSHLMMGGLVVAGYQLDVFFLRAA